MNSKLTIVNQDLKFQKVSLIAPSDHYFIHLAAEVDHTMFPFFLWESKRKKDVLHALKSWCKQLEKEAGIIDATVFKASVIPPGKGKLLKERKDKVQVARYDVAVLIEVDSLAGLKLLQKQDNYQEMIRILKEKSSRLHMILARNVRRINPVDHRRSGVFLFNYFYADKVAQNLGIWEYTAGWFEQETGLDNSTLLLPLEGEISKYTIINHCRWDHLRAILPSLLFKRSFRRYVLANFYANQVAAMPILYKLA